MNSELIPGSKNSLFKPDPYSAGNFTSKNVLLRLETALYHYLYFKII